MSGTRVLFKQIRLGKIPNYRKWPEKKIAELAASIEANGLLQPLLVREGKDETGKKIFDLIDGEGRYTAIARIQTRDKDAFEMVPVHFTEGNDQEMLYRRFEANNARNTHGPLDIAEYVQLMQNRQVKLEAIAKRTGLSQAWICRLMRVRKKCAPDVLVAVSEGTVPMSAAYEMSTRSEKEQLRLLEAYTATKKKAGRKAAKRAINRVQLPTKAQRRGLVTLASKELDNTPAEKDFDRGFWCGVLATARWGLGEISGDQDDPVREIEKKIQSLEDE